MNGLTLFWCIAAMLVIAGAGRAAEAPSAESMVRDYYATFSESPFDVDRLMVFYAENVVFVDPTFDISVTGVDEVRALYAAIGTDDSRYRDIRWQIERVIADADDVAIHGRWSGRFDGKAFDIEFVTLWRLAEGRIVEQRDFFDAPTFDEQVGWQGQ